MKKLLLLILPLLILLSSCELMLPNNKTDRNVYLVSLALNYDQSGVKVLNCTISDQNAIFNELKYITNKTYSPFEYILVSQKGKNLIINDNGNITKEVIYSTNPSEVIKNPPEVIKKSIIKKLNLFSQNMDENDILIFHYSGHGDDDGGLVYYVEEKKDIDEGLVNKEVNKNYYKLFPADLFNSIQSNKGTTLLFLDSCYSGFFYDYISSDLNSPYFSNLFNPPGKRNNIFTLTAVNNKELAWENNGYGNLTRAFLENLGYNTTTNTPGMKQSHIWFSELITSIQRNIKLYINGSIQHPQGNEIKDFLLY